MLWIIFALGRALAGDSPARAPFKRQLLWVIRCGRCLCVGVALLFDRSLCQSRSSQGRRLGRPAVFRRMGRWRRLLVARSARSARSASSFAFKYGCLPTYVMPLVFAGAPLGECGSFRCGCIRQRHPIPCSFSNFCWQHPAHGMVLSSNPRREYPAPLSLDSGLVPALPARGTSALSTYGLVRHATKSPAVVATESR